MRGRGSRCGQSHAQISLALALAHTYLLLGVITISGCGGLELADGPFMHPFRLMMIPNRSNYIIRSPRGKDAKSGMRGGRWHLRGGINIEIVFQSGLQPVLQCGPDIVAISPGTSKVVSGGTYDSYTGSYVPDSLSGWALLRGQAGPCSRAKG